MTMTKYSSLVTVPCNACLLIVLQGALQVVYLLVRCSPSEERLDVARISLQGFTAVPAWAAAAGPCACLSYVTGVQLVIPVQRCMLGSCRLQPAPEPEVCRSGQLQRTVLLLMQLCTLRHCRCKDADEAPSLLNCRRPDRVPT